MQRAQTNWSFSGTTCALCEGQEVNVSTVPEGIASADVIVWGKGSTFAQQIAAGPHHLKSDEPKSAGGTDTGPSPYDFLLAALGSCTSINVGLRESWALGALPPTVWLVTRRFRPPSATKSLSLQFCGTGKGTLGIDLPSLVAVPIPREY